MNRSMHIATLVALALPPLAGPAFAQATSPVATTPAAARVLTELPDPDLAALRGRFMLGNHTVAYFGISMLSSWTTPEGQALNGGVTVGMHFNGTGWQAPLVTFTPSLNIVRGTPLPPAGADGATRSVDGSGLANVNGLTQGIQVAGDGNRAVNVTALRVSEGTAASGNTSATSAPFDSRIDADGASVAVAFDPTRGVSVNLGIAGQGLVSQWIRTGSVGQLVQLTADGQTVNNQLQLDLVLNPASTSNVALRDAASALLQSRMGGFGG